MAKKNKAQQRIFGTDGIRGVANQPPMTVEMLSEVGRSIAYVLAGTKKRNKILIGKDTRLSGYMIESALSAGLCSMGADVLLVGPMPTAGVAFLTQSMRADAGLVISASHNPYMDNGIKIFSRDGFKLADEREQEIESKLFSQELEQHRPTNGSVGKAFRIDDAIGRYIVFLKATFPKACTLDGLTLVLDCANGAAYKLAPAVFEELGATVVKRAVEPNGLNINDGCGALYAEELSNTVRQHGADLGIALDGDADRAMLVDELGQIVDGDHMLAICAEAKAADGNLTGSEIVGTSMSNVGLALFLRERGLSLLRTQVGDRYVVEEMRRRNLSLGGEPSGHIIFMDENTTGDGIVTALQVLAVMRKQDKTLSELRSRLTKFPQTLKNFAVAHKPPIESLDKTTALIHRIEGDLGEKGRVVVRYSGTEKKARVMVEGEKMDQIENYAQDIVKMMSTEIGRS